MHSLSLGTYAGVYLLVTYLYLMTQYLLYALFVLVAGALSGLDLFRRNSAGAFGFPVCLLLVCMRRTCRALVGMSSSTAAQQLAQLLMRVCTQLLSKPAAAAGHRA
jgi:hypothetical protein